MDQTVNQPPITLTDLLRHRFQYILDPIGAFFNRLGIPPNTMTIMGLVGNMVGAYFLARGQFTLGGVFILASGPFDALDGTMARLLGRSDEFGAFVDSVTDRYSELVIYGGLLLNYLSRGDWVACILVYLAACGSVLVSYVRSRAQSLGFEAKVGILTRLERYLVLAPALVLRVPLVGLGIVAVLANITALQRIYHVRKQAHSRLHGST